MLRRLLGRDRFDDARLTAADWDRDYAGGRWSYLDGLAEMARTAVVAGYAAAAGVAEPAILDIGCGEGVLLRAIRHRPYRAYLGLDLSPIAVEQARAAAGPRDRFVAADARTFIPNQALDIIVFNEVLYYFEDVAGVVVRYRDMLAPDGIMIASTHVRRRTDHVWPAIARVAHVADRVTIRHDNGTAWRVGLITPRPAS